MQARTVTFFSDFCSFSWPNILLWSFLVSCFSCSLFLSFAAFLFLTPSHRCLFLSLLLSSLHFCAFSCLSTFLLCFPLFSLPLFLFCLFSCCLTTAVSFVSTCLIISYWIASSLFSFPFPLSYPLSLPYLWFSLRLLPLSVPSSPLV